MSEPIDFSVWNDLASCRDVQMCRLFENGDNNLTIEFIELLPGEKEDVTISGHIFRDSVPIAEGAQSCLFQVCWSRYIAFDILNESFSKKNADIPLWERGRISCYKESAYLNYLKATSYASDIWPGPFQHIRIVCVDHVIEVASSEQPSIRMGDDGDWS